MIKQPHEQRYGQQGQNGNQRSYSRDGRQSRERAGKRVDALTPATNAYCA